MALVFRAKIRGSYNISDDLEKIMEENPDKPFSKISIDKNIIDLDLNYVIKVLDNVSICTVSTYEDALFINELVNKGKIKVGQIHLKDDFKMKDRSYVDFSLFKNTVFLIPTSYYMWGVRNVNDSKTELKQKTLDEVERIAKMISEFPEKLTDVEKVILIVNYIQHYCEFIGSKIDILNRTQEQFELLDDSNDNREVIQKLCHKNYNQVGSTAEEPLFQNYGICSGFSSLLTLLFNNPYIKIRAEYVSGDSHAWNVVQIGDKYYNLDVTRSITYSPYRAKHNLRTLKFNKGYILVGTDFLEKDGHERRETSLDYAIEESKEDFNPDYLDAAIEHLMSTGLVQFEYENEYFYRRESSPLNK